MRRVDGDDAEAGLICSFVDVDERHRARESLALQAERTRAILNSVLVGIVTVSERGIEWMNRSARRMFGGELADFVGEPISTVATPEPDHPLRSTDLLQRLLEGQAETFECRLKGRDGREFWVVGNAVLTRQPAGGGAPELTFALLDIERRRQAEISIAQAQASLQRVIETAPLAIALFDGRTLRVQQLNQMASVFFGRPVHEVLGATPEACCAPAQAAALRAWLHGHGGRRPGGPARMARGWRRSCRRCRASGTAASRPWTRATRVPCSCCSWPATSPASVPPSAHACMPPSRSARCWCARCTIASRTTCRASPGCCSRMPCADPSWRKS